MKFLVIQTAFLGDVILATAVVEKLKQHFPDAHIDFFLRKGNEAVFENPGYPGLQEVLIYDKKQKKPANLFSLIKKVRAKKYDAVVNLNRFGSSGLLTCFSGAKEKIGFDKNPFSFCYTKKINHEIGTGKHETERNQQLIAHLTDPFPAKPKLYPAKNDFEKAKSFLPSQSSTASSYICIAPASVWHTKQFPKEKWTAMIELLSNDLKIFLIGSKEDFQLCEEIKLKSKKEGMENLAGKMSVLQTAALMKNARMNYVNDSAPLHIASAVNAPVTAAFCSTVPAFGFGPLSENSKIVETSEKLSCRPCGLHGHSQCPEGHFKCAQTISVQELL